MKYAWLPELLAEIAEAAGLDAALKLAQDHGGTRKRIPAAVRDDEHWLVKSVGKEAAVKICAHYRQRTASDTWRGIYVSIPLGPTGAVATARRRMAEALKGGATASEAAKLSGMTERTAYRRRRKINGRDDGSQGRLF